jgi:hypothetical protein
MIGGDLVPICRACWDDLHGDELPTAISFEPEPIRCEFCGWVTRAGIYVPRSDDE